MKRNTWLFSLVTLFCLNSAFAQTTQPAEEEDIIYRPPTAAASNARMGGGSRSDVKLPTIAALVPEHMGLTASPIPQLFWFCSEDTTLPREFSLVDSQSLDTIKRVEMHAPITAGWQKIDLKELEVELKPNVAYEWRIALIANTTNRSDNAVAGGMVQYVEKADNRSNIGALKHASELAAKGLWYDALAVVMSELDRDPQAKKMLVMLLEQVNLKDAAEFAAK